MEALLDRLGPNGAAGLSTVSAMVLGTVVGVIVSAVCLFIERKKNP